jgi:hypothetical protein
MSKFNEDTISHFKFESAYISREEVEVRENIVQFVEVECQLNGDETEEMLVNDLMNLIYIT